ncbi:hypothetical protein Q4588_14235 [Tamlana sp. 1_MG-2023]|uniref:hypothetical protein n=1 Tax=Tamlana sp. 1_MG-2023 TaxID=3062628 RepID=UPI0026E3E443|nr:hypothetical protein [Tamlana sp. 1_MG-2023]MDO6792064.1 hypothetical protein [Tamlana sp. 1_MG-2023]
MKKIIAIVAFMLLTLSVISQKKTNPGEACYMFEAQATFNLSEIDQAELVLFRLEKNDKNNEITKQLKAGEISKEDAKKQRRVINQKYFKDFSTLTGKSKKEIQNFEKAMKIKCGKK